MLRLILHFDGKRFLTLMGFVLMVVLAMAWMAFESSKAVSSGSLVCEPRGKAGAKCHEVNSGAPPDSALLCESHGRGGRLCFAIRS